MEARLMPAAPEALASRHVVEGFSCGEEVLDVWLRKRALANQASGASRTFVACDAAVVVAYYALASSAVAVSHGTGRFRRNMPDPIPVVVLGRLAVATSHHGRGLGRAMFQDAARRVVNAGSAIGIRGLIVHALSDEAAAFYERLGLDRSSLDPMTLIVTIADLAASL